MATAKKKTPPKKKISFIKKAPKWWNTKILAAVFIGFVAITGGYYVLVSSAAWSGALSLGSASSGWCMGASNTTTGSYVVINHCSNQIDQKWLLNPTTTWQGHTVYAVQNQKSHLCVDNYGQSKAIGSANPLRMYPCTNGDTAQQFIWTNVTNKHALYNPQTGHCMDDQGGAYVPGNHVDLYTCKTSGFVNQEWIEIANSAGSTQPPDTNSTMTKTFPFAAQLPIKNAAGYHMCLDDNGDSSVNNAKVDVWQCNGSHAQSWSANTAGEILINGKCLAVNGNGKTNGTLVSLYTCNGTAGQKWTWNSTLGIPSTFVNPNSGRCLDDKGYSAVNGTQLEIYDCNGGKNQLWYPVTPATSSLK